METIKDSLSKYNTLYIVFVCKKHILFCVANSYYYTTSLFCMCMLFQTTSSCDALKLCIWSKHKPNFSQVVFGDTILPPFYLTIIVLKGDESERNFLYNMLDKAVFKIFRIALDLFSRYHQSVILNVAWRVRGIP